jgi:predicted Abi (CAAX) family protease
VRINVLPKTSWGKWSAGLIVAFILFLALFLILVASGQRGGETFFSNLLLTVPMLLAGTCGVAAFVTGLIGIIKSKERSILVYLAIFIGFDILVFCLGEVLVPH